MLFSRRKMRQRSYAAGAARAFGSDNYVCLTVLRDFLVANRRAKFFVSSQAAVGPRAPTSIGFLPDLLNRPRAHSVVRAGRDFSEFRSLLLLFRCVATSQCQLVEGEMA